MENWKIIKGYPNYSISNLGNVKNNKTDRVLKQHKKAGRYFAVELQPKKQFFIHRLVAENFLENPKKLPFVNHKNGNGFDNKKENLEWITQKDNIIHSRKITKNGSVISYKKIKEIFETKETLTKKEFYLDLLSNCK
jgi:hypothetical protein